jgi:hypothetical protein
MRFTRPGAGGQSNRIFYPAKGLNMTGSDRIHSRLSLFRLHFWSLRLGFLAVPFTPKRSGNKGLGKISPLKCRRNPPIRRGGKTAPGGRKLPEGKTGGRLYKDPPRGKDAV